MRTIQVQLDNDVSDDDLQYLVDLMRLAARYVGGGNCTVYVGNLHTSL